MYRNVTIRLTEEAAKWARRKAAEEDTSVSRLVGHMLEGAMRHEEEYRRAFQHWTELQRWPLAKYGAERRASREETHDRARDRENRG